MPAFGIFERGENVRDTSSAFQDAQGCCKTRLPKYSNTVVLVLFTYTTALVEALTKGHFSLMEIAFAPYGQFLCSWKLGLKKPVSRCIYFPTEYIYVISYPVYRPSDRIYIFFFLFFLDIHV